MKALVTGARGTVGTALCACLAEHGHEVIAWDRDRVPVDDYHAMEAFVRASAPDVLFHLAIFAQPTGRDNESWLVNYEWPSELAWITRILDIDLVFTSTAMVFSDRAVGPFTRASVPDAEHGYGHVKRCAEDRVFAQNPRARVVRLGWQIGDSPGSNNMLDYLERAVHEHGEVRASTRWLPATSFLADTAEALASLPASPPGLYMLDSNTGWSFHDIARALSEVHGRRWTITATEDFVYDQRLMDGGVSMPSLARRLPLGDPQRSVTS